MKFNEVVGSATIDVSHLRAFLRCWYRPGDIVSLIGIPTTGSRQVLSMAQSVNDLMVATNEDLGPLTYIPEEDKRMNMYISVNPLIEEHSVDLRARGSKADVRAIYGTFIDFDISKAGTKEGAFDSKQEVFDFLTNIPTPPTMVIENGENGGIHAYWRLMDADVPEADESLLLRWWAYISSMTGKKIDKLIDKTRISRVPSCIYWPKDSSMKVDTVKTLTTDGPQYSLNSMVSVSLDAFQKHQAKVAALRDQKTRIDPTAWETRVLQLAREGGSGRKLSAFQAKVAMTRIDTFIDECFEWAEILEPHDWTFLKENSDGSKTWARPGKSERSAVVDYVDGSGRKSGVMSLLSSSPDTLLEDLKEAGVPLTKKQVLLRLHYKDDIHLMVDDLYERSAGIDEIP